MLRSSCLTILLCLCLSFGAQAEPIGWNQIERNLISRVSFMTDPLSPAAALPQGQLDQPLSAEESPNHPEFVRLPDGRIVPYGRGVICDENCVEDFSESSRRPKLWLIAPPIIVGGIICAILCGGDHGGNPTGNPRIFGGTDNPPRPLPTPSSSVPEPATLILLGAGLALLASKGIKRR